MNKDIDLTKILADCPKGWKFWSPILGEVEFECNYGNKGSINISVNKEGTDWYFTSDAKIILGGIKSQEIMIYPSRYFHDWSRFTAPWDKKERFDPKKLNPFDKVLIWKELDCTWIPTLFTFLDFSLKYPRMRYGSFVVKVIPYNNDTKHLLGASVEAPEYYRYWED